MDTPDKIFRLSEGLAVITEIRNEELPEELAESMKTTELLLRGYIHLLEEELTHGH